jgi:hypothetical protein
MKLVRDAMERLERAWGWVIAQFVGTAVLIMVGLAWTRIPDRTGAQVAISILLPVLLIAALVLLQAATIRRLIEHEENRVYLVWGALSFLVWLSLAWASWALLDWCDNWIPQLAGYINSKMPPHPRITIFSYDHITRFFAIVEWILHWIVVPWEIILCAVASAQWGWRLPWRKLVPLMVSWRWRPVVIFGSLVAVAWPQAYFDSLPHGTVAHQVWAVVFKLGAAYFLAIASWVVVLAWAAALVSSLYLSSDLSEWEPVIAKSRKRKIQRRGLSLLDGGES